MLWSHEFSHIISHSICEVNLKICKAKCVISKADFCEILQIKNINFRNLIDSEWFKRNSNREQIYCKTDPAPATQYSLVLTGQWAWWNSLSYFQNYTMNPLPVTALSYWSVTAAKTQIPVCALIPHLVISSLCLFLISLFFSPERDPKKRKREKEDVSHKQQSDWTPELPNLPPLNPNPSRRNMAIRSQHHQLRQVPRSTHHRR